LNYYLSTTLPVIINGAHPNDQCQVKTGEFCFDSSQTRCHPIVDGGKAVWIHLAQDRVHWQPRMNTEMEPCSA